MMTENLLLSDVFNLEEINFDLGITKDLLNLPFITLNGNEITTNDAAIIKFEKKLFLPLAFLLPSNILSYIFSDTQNCRKLNSFYGFNTNDNTNHIFGFVQVFENYNNPDDKLFVFLKTNIDGEFQEKLQQLLEKFSTNPFLSLYPPNTEYKDFNFHCELGNILFHRELLKEALIEYRISLKFERNNAHALFGIANVYDKKENYDKAIKYYLKTKDIEQNHPMVHRKLGDAYYYMGQHDKALEEYSTVIDIANDSLITGYSHFSIGIIHEERKKYNKAISQYKQALKMRPNYDFAHYKLGTIYLKKGNSPKAISFFKQAAILRPNSFLYLEQLALAYSKNGDLDKAIWAYKMALKINSHDIRTLLNLGFMYSQQGDVKHALATYKKALEINPVNAEVYYYIGLAYVSHDLSLEEALNFYIKTITINPRHVSARNQIGLIYYILKDYKKAIKEFHLCLSYEPGFVLGYKNLGLLYKEVKKFGSSIDYYSKAIDLGDSDFECYFNRGLCHYLKEEWHSASEDFRMALKLRPEQKNIHELLNLAEQKKLIQSEKTSN